MNGMNKQKKNIQTKRVEYGLEYVCTVDMDSCINVTFLRTCRVYVGTNTCEIFNNIRGGIEILTSTRKIGTMKAFKAEFDLI